MRSTCSTFEPLEDRRLLSGVSCSLVPTPSSQATPQLTPAVQTASLHTRAKAKAAAVNLVGTYHGTWTEAISGQSGTIDATITSQTKTHLTGSVTIFGQTFSGTIPLKFVPRSGVFRIPFDRFGIKSLFQGTLETVGDNIANHLVGTFAGHGFGHNANGTFDILRVS